MDELVEATASAVETPEKPDTELSQPETAEPEAAPEPEKTEPEKNKPKKEPFDFKKAAAALFAALASFGGLLARNIKAVSAGAFRFFAAVGSSCAKTLGKTLATAFYGALYLLARFFASAKTTLKAIAFAAGRLCYRVGACSWQVFSALVSAGVRFVKNFLSAFFGAIFGWLKKKFKQPLYELWCFILTPFAHAYGAVAHAHLSLKKARKISPLHAVRSVFSSLWRFFCGFCEVLRFLFNYAAPVISIIFLISLVRYASTLQYAISVEYNGSDIGTIENEAAFNEAESLVQDKITFTDENSQVLSKPKFSVTVLNLDDSSEPISDIDQLSEIMIEGGETPIVYAYGFYINDELIGVYSEEDMETIRDALNARLELYNTPNAFSVEFEDDIVILEGRFIESVLTTPEEALSYINGTTTVEAYYTVVRGDSISKICENLGITEDEFKRDNPALTEGVSRGDIVTYHYEEPRLNVLTTHYENYEQVIERTTEYVESSRYEQYCEILLQHGSDGYENVTALVTETNGKETDRTIVSRTVLEEMVPRKFRVGTKENTYLDGDTTIIDRLGTFCWPLGDEDCYISSDFGYRSWDHSNHKAIDIAGIPRGTDIYAACDGKVTFSGWYAAYGELVIVDCGGGYECYYGHCSELDVEVGDRVEKGDVIAHVGMTGSASGNHLHFEMRYHDERINPFMALGGPGGHRFNMS